MIQNNDNDIIDLKCEIGETNYDVICPIHSYMNLVYNSKYYLYYSDNFQRNMNTSINVLSLYPYYNKKIEDINSAYNLYGNNVNILKFLILVFCLFV